MNTKVTKNRINEHLSYDWIKYVAIILVVIVVFSLIYDMGAKKLSLAQTFEIYILNGTEIESNSQNFQEDLLKRLNGDETPVDSNGNKVYHKDQVIEAYVNSYGAYSEDGDVQQAVSVKLQGGQESDIIILDYSDFTNFLQTWFVSITDYKKQLEDALAENLPVVSEYPDVASGSEDVDGIKKSLEKQLWTSIQEEYNKFFVDRTESDEEGNENALTRYEKFGYRQAKVLPEGIEKWTEISNTLQQKVNSLGTPSESNKADYEAAMDEFNKAYAALPKEEEKVWGLDIAKFDLVNVKENWFNTSNSAYRRLWGETEDSGMYFVLGLMNFGRVNGTSYFELVKVLNFVIERYAYPQTI